MASMTEDANLIDPYTTERQIYRERTTGIEREIWRPGDGEGDQGTDYYDRPGAPLPLEQRWRLFQSDIGRIRAMNQPPRYVMLDDRAVHDVLMSDIPRAKLPQNWPHEFGGLGKIRTRRIHRGRPAIKDINAEGDAKYHSGPTATGKDTYVLSGEKDFQPILYRYEPPQHEPKRKKRPRMPSPTSEEYNPRGHGHNQYTPKDMMVKNGAASFSLKEKKTGLQRPSPLFTAGSTPSYENVSRECSTGMTPESGQQGDEAAGHFDPNKFPPNMGYIERQAFEQQLAARTMASIQSEEDVKKVASELAKAHVKIGQQGYEIDRLKDDLAADENSSRLELKKVKALATRFEQKASQQADEMAILKDEIAAGKRRENELRGEIDALRQGTWWHS